MTKKISTREVKHLEVTMRDVLDGLEDAASYMNYHSTPDIIEILSIESPGRAVQPLQEVIPLNKIYTVNSQQSANIVDYLIQRELKKSA